MMIEPHPYLYQSSNITIYTHGAFFAFGALLSYVVALLLARRRGLPTEQLSGWAVWVFLLGLIGARLGFFFAYSERFQSLAQLLSIWGGGLVSYFGIATGAITAWILVKRETAKDIWLWASIIVAATLSAWSVGRIGNFLARDSVGIESPSWQVFYGRVPIQLFETVLCGVLAIVGARLIWKRQESRLLALYLGAGYFFGRFIIDYWRDEGGAFFHNSQWVSLITGVILVGIIYFKEKYD